MCPDGGKEGEQSLHEWDQSKGGNCTTATEACFTDFSAEKPVNFRTKCCELPSDLLLSPRCLPKRSVFLGLAIYYIINT